ncbi:MAG: hypothetical protein ABFC84_06995 [Veillonellales bacterium]
MRKLISLIFLLLVFVNVTFAETGSDNNFQYILSTEEESFFFDTKSVKFLSENIIEVSYRKQYSEKGKQEQIESARHLFGDQFNDIQYEDIQVNLDIKDQKSKVLIIKCFDSKGNVIHCFNMAGSMWCPVSYSARETKKYQSVVNYAKEHFNNLSNE